MNHKTWIAEARQIAAQCWCDEGTKNTVMDPVLAEAVALRIASWMHTAAQAENNTQYYRDLLVRAGKAIGAAAYTADDGGRHEDVLVAKVPELVEALSKQGFIQSFTELAHLAHENSRSKGFWALIDSFEEHPQFNGLEVIWKLSRIALMHSEGSEALEGIRKNLPDDHLPHRSMEVTELADLVIRILDYAGGYELPLAEVILEKMAYNTHRPFMHGGKG